jgi:hypothetical protein
VDLDAATLQLRRAVQRFGGDPAARRPLLAEQKRLTTALQALNVERRCPRTLGTPEPVGTETTRGELTTALVDVRKALAAVRTQCRRRS